MREYCNTLLNFHAQAGATSPLYLEPRILTWLLHKDSSIVDQLIQGLPLSDVADLAAWLGSEVGGSEDWKSAQVYYVLALQGDLAHFFQFVIKLVLSSQRGQVLSQSKPHISVIALRLRTGFLKGASPGP